MTYQLNLFPAPASPFKTNLVPLTPSSYIYLLLNTRTTSDQDKTKQELLGVLVAPNNEEHDDGLYSAQMVGYFFNGGLALPPDLTLYEGVTLFDGEVTDGQCKAQYLTEEGVDALITSLRSDPYEAMSKLFIFIETEKLFNAPHATH